MRRIIFQGVMTIPSTMGIKSLMKLIQDKETFAKEVEREREREMKALKSSLVTTTLSAVIEFVS